MQSENPQLGASRNLAFGMLCDELVLSAEIMLFRMFFAVRLLSFNWHFDGNRVGVKNLLGDGEKSFRNKFPGGKPQNLPSTRHLSKPHRCLSCG